MKKMIALVGVSILLTGCSTMTAVDKNKKVSVINATFTQLEYGNADKWGKIDTYLNKRVKDGYITEDDRFVISECLKRADRRKK